MKVTVRPTTDPQREIDLTHSLVSAIAKELWRLYGRNDRLNWLEAELHLQQIVQQAREDAQKEVESDRANLSPNRWYPFCEDRPRMPNLKADARGARKAGTR